MWIFWNKNQIFFFCFDSFQQCCEIVKVVENTLEICLVLYFNYFFQYCECFYASRQEFEQDKNFSSETNVEFFYLVWLLHLLEWINWAKKSSD